MTDETLPRQIRALEDRCAYLDLEGWQLTEVRGPDARSWLDDLVTASLSHLSPGEAVRSLLLSPTGKIRADFHVFRPAEGPEVRLLQGPGQPTDVATALEPYVLSSHVEVARLDPSGLIVSPASGAVWSVSTREPPGHWVRVGEDALEAWRIRLGVARFPVDLDRDSVPAEGGLDTEPVIDRSKGCYLGQESVARIRNLGHPPRVIVGVRADAMVRSGMPVLANGSSAGRVTSVSPDGYTEAMVRIRWDARDTEITTDDGMALERR